MITLSFNIKKWAPAFILLAVIFTGCTKLDVKTYSAIPGTAFWADPKNIPLGKGPVYTALGQIVGHGTVGNMIEINSDEMVYPTRGTDWYDGGQWARMYYHQGLPSDIDNNIDGCWQAFANGASAANFVISNIQAAGNDPNLAQDVAEMETARSFFYYKGMELFGNIPYVTSFGVNPANVKTLPMKQVFDSLVLSLTNALPNLSTAVDNSTYGRCNKYMAEALLAKLYLGAKYFTGGAEDHYADCIAMCNDIINNGGYTLSSNYFDIFYGVNNTNTENIFVAPMASTLLNGNGLVQATIQFNSALTFGIPCCNYGNNGASTTKDFYQYFDTTSTYSLDTTIINGRTVHSRRRTFNDMRTASYLIGQQFVGDGVKNYPPNVNWLVDNDDQCCVYSDGSGLTTAQSLKIGDDYNGLKSPVVYYDTMTEFTFGTAPAYFRHAGLRNIKYWPQPGTSNGSMGNAWVIYRKADIYLIRAEAEFWMGDVADAAADINQVRGRAYNSNLSHIGLITTADVTADFILQERGRELSWEDTRRSDLIRMQYLTGTPYFTRQRFYPPKDADASDNHTFLLPVPTVELNHNTNLTQNPGYPNN